MNLGFWAKLNKPILSLAPMANVTDSAFRQVILECGRPDVFFNEFISCDGLCSPGRERLMKELSFTKKEKPLVAQFFGAKPENFYTCAQMAVDLGFDGIDINMGCPDKSVLKQGSGAALTLNPKLAKEIIKETTRGAGGLPVSVKTRLGFDKNIIDTWLPHLLEMELAVITVHGRTAKKMSNVPADWDAIGKAAGIARGSGTLIFGNGDVEDLNDAKKKAEKYGLDGIMVGRGIFLNPWFFNPKVDFTRVTPEEKINLLLHHMELFITLWGDNRNFDSLKRFFKIYISGWSGAKELRIKLMATKNAEDVREVIRGFRG